jgi:malic enzyme
MEEYRRVRGADGIARVEVPVKGADLLRHPMYTKSTAFTLEERRLFEIDGLLPSVVSTLDRQCRRAYAHIQRKEDPLEKYIGLAALLDRNETLFYRVLVDHVEEFLPIVYTPTVGLACQRFSHIFRRGRGLWITPDHVGRIDEVLGYAPWRDVRLVVVTDNERILGLGDQGAGGMAIPIGKLSLYTAAAGVHPTRCLPVSLDVGTDNEALRNDPLYVGYRQPRLRGAPYYALVDEFVRAVAHRFPRALLQWEDFKKDAAFQLMDRYRDVLPSFNDDVQGTAAVVLAGVLAGCRATSTPLLEQRVVILGAGAAGIGIARLLRSALLRAGASPEHAHRAVAMVDLGGLLVEGDHDADPRAAELMWPAQLAEAQGLARGPRDLETVVRALRPTALIGITGAPGAFTEPAVRAMAAGVARPLVFPLSNPTSHSEAKPIDVLRWTEGRALIATGSPFFPVMWEGGTVQISQANNALVFPGVGLGALVSDARVITDGMFAVAAERLAELVDAEALAAGALFPSMRELRTVTAEVAVAVARAAREEGIGRPLPEAELPAIVRGDMWDPVYEPLIRI